MLDRSGPLLALARPVAPTLASLAVLHLVELLVLPLLVFFGRATLGWAVPIAVGLLARALRLFLHQRARRRLRQAFMARAARDSLSQHSPVDAGADAAFWGAHILEYALCVDVPAIIGAALGVAVIVLLAAIRLGGAPVAALTTVLFAATVASLLTGRLRRSQVDAIVERRHEMAVWMAAAMQDRGEIRSQRATEAFLEVATARAQHWSSAEDGLERRQTLHRATIALAAVACLLLVAHGFGLTAGFSRVMSLDTLASFLLAGTLLPAAYSLNAHLESLAVTRAELLRLLPDRDATSTRGTLQLSAPPTRLSLSGVRVSYDKALALELDSLELDLGRPVVITGPNGAGKTTLARLVAGLTQPSRGELRIDGSPAHSFAADGIAFVPQDPVLVESLSVLENIQLVAPSCSRDDALALLAELGMPRLNAVLDGPLGSYSRGEGRRIATARALLAPARLLVLDEPDAWLDAASRARLVDVLVERAKSCSIVLVSHRLDVIGRFDQIVALSAAHGVEAVGDRAEVAARSAAFRALSEGELPLSNH